MTTPTSSEKVEQVEALESKLRCVISHATGGGTQDTKLSLNDVCVRITAFRNRLWEDAKELGRKEAHAPQAQAAGDVEREVREMRRRAADWRRPALRQIEGPNDLKIYGGTIADDIEKWADMLLALSGLPNDRIEAQARQQVTGCRCAKCMEWKLPEAIAALPPVIAESAGGGEVASRLNERVSGITTMLAEPMWKPSRSHIEACRNLLAEAAATLATPSSIAGER